MKKIPSPPVRIKAGDGFSRILRYIHCATATMRAITAMNVIWSNIFKSRSGKEETHIIEILRRIPVFEDLTKRELASIERILHKREYKQEEVIFRQGEPGVGMYIIEQGKVHILHEPGNTRLAELGNGEFFGELALLDESPRSASAIAIDPSAILGFFQPDLFGLIERDPQLGVKIVMRLARSIGERLRRANEQLQKYESNPT